MRCLFQILDPQHPVIPPLGGLWTLPSGNVRRVDDRSFEGLYAAGSTASGIPARAYNTGTSLDDATFFGRLAGEAVAARAAAWTHLRSFEDSHRAPPMREHRPPEVNRSAGHHQGPKIRKLEPSVPWLSGRSWSGCGSTLEDHPTLLEVADLRLKEKWRGGPMLQPQEELACPRY